MSSPVSTIHTPNHMYLCHGNSHRWKWIFFVCVSRFGMCSMRTNSPNRHQWNIAYEWMPLAVCWLVASGVGVQAHSRVYSRLLLRVHWTQHSERRPMIKIYGISMWLFVLRTPRVHSRNFPVSTPGASINFREKQSRKSNEMLTSTRRAPEWMMANNRSSAGNKSKDFEKSTWFIMIIGGFRASSAAHRDTQKFSTGNSTGNSSGNFQV